MVRHSQPSEEHHELMDTRGLYRLWSLLLLTIVLSETAYGSSDRPPLDAQEDLAFWGQQDRPGSPYRAADNTLEDPFTAENPIQQGTPVTDSGGSQQVPPLGRYIQDFFPDLVGGTKRIFYRDNLPIVLVGVGLTGLAFTQDQRVKKYFQDRKPLEHVEKYGDKIGGGYPEVGVGVLLLGTGEVFQNKKLADTGAVALEAYAIDGVATELLKGIARRKRPNGGNHNSFPSGHASITSTMAASISEMYDWNPAIAVPLYATAVFVGASRIQANEHFLSDVLAGLTLGTLVGSSVAKYHKEKTSAAGLQNITLLPVYTRDYKGMVVLWRF